MAGNIVSKTIQIKDGYSSSLGKLEKGILENVNALSKLDNEVNGTQSTLGKLGKQQKDLDSSFKSANMSISKLSKSTGNANKKNKEYVDGLDDISKKVKGNESILSKFGNSLGEAFKKDGIKGVAGALGGLITQFAIAKEGIEGVKSAIDTTIEQQSDRQKATNKISGATGLSKSDAEKYNKSISDLYTSGYGEDRTELANTISLIAQQIGKLDIDKMTEFAKSIMAIENTFGTDANESIRGTNAMMKQFGVTSEQALNLLVQGAQNGLNQNSDLFDQMSEYSVYWKELGFSAQDAMNMLKAGIDSGAFQVDKLNDAIKELRIRGKDGSADQYFQMLGLDATQTKKNLNAGGATAKDTTLDILNRLSRVIDKSQQFQIGQGIMGTQWEDVGSQSILALTNYGKEQINISKDVMTDLKNNQYSDLKSRFSRVSRDLESAFAPIEEMLVPELDKFADWIENKLTPWIENKTKWLQGDSKSSNFFKSSIPFIGEIFDATKPKVDGNQNGRKAGLNRVPYDNYYTYLHQGERVLTRRQAEEVDQGNSRNAGSSIMIAKLADSIVVREDADIDKITNQLVQKLQSTSLILK
ncbi:phage tail tape measure protein [Clostridium beijerinckii]|uniref:phage tail tape measure protein n=1 Tax=Clostridium beijerinckii TaxID=1520 RepID=UPI00098C7AC1|nr:phage tail tape measure protein [Clostridium beijerinckii]NRT78114.1 phage-related minor tail protein [Clostridium beijerinckii]OOM44805.1 phage-related minor tail protein [Clostridium beijerinckii]